MPTNLFNTMPGQTMGRVSGNLGFNVPSMIQGGMARGMQDVEERKAQARRAFIEDMLTQQLQQAQIGAQTRGLETDTQAKQYHLGQEQEYYQGLHTPQGQAMWKAYQERMGLPSTGDVTNPEQIKDLTGLSHEVIGQRQHEQAMAEHLLSNYYPTPGQPERPEIAWARSVLGTGGGVTQPATNAPPVVPPKPATVPKSAAGVFMHEALPSFIGGGGGMALASKVPGLWKVPAFGVGGLLGDKLTRMVQGDLSQEDVENHPMAANLGNTAGWIASLLGGNLKSLGSLRKGVTAPSSASGALASGVKVKPQTFSQRLQALTSKPQQAQPMRGSPYTQPIQGLPQSMGNVPVPQMGANLPSPVGAVPPPTMAPRFSDPAIQRLLGTLFKKAPTPVAGP